MLVRAVLAVPGLVLALGLVLVLDLVLDLGLGPSLVLLLVF